MKFGTGFPLAATGDVASVRAFAQGLDKAGFDYVTSAGHVLSAEPGRYPDRPNPTYVGPFYDPFVLFSHLAAITEHLSFRTAILILPLFPTVLVAKQASELSLLSGGRFQLGVGISWQESEYQAMGQNLHTRGRRLEEQVNVLRRLWSEPYVSFEGRWHTLDRVGLNRLPSSPIPIWMGSSTDNRVLRRVARMADGWMPLGDPAEALPRLRQHLKDAGRDTAAFGLTARVAAGPDGPKAWIDAAKRAQSMGASELIISAPPDLALDGVLQRVVAARQAILSELG